MMAGKEAGLNAIRGSLIDLSHAICFLLNLLQLDKPELHHLWFREALRKAGSGYSQMMQADHEAQCNDSDLFPRHSLARHTHRVQPLCVLPCGTWCQCI